MATWDKTEYKAECEKCGKKYNVIKWEQPLREKGRFNCSGCNHEMQYWNGGVDFSFTEV
jgi:hypothetical protein